METGGGAQVVFHKDMMALTKQGAAQGSGTHLGTHPRLCPMALSWPTKDPRASPPANPHAAHQAVAADTWGAAAVPGG